jgi:hypothetical protein
MAFWALLKINLCSRLWQIINGERVRDACARLE